MKTERSNWTGYLLGRRRQELTQPGRQAQLKRHTMSAHRTLHAEAVAHRAPWKPNAMPTTLMPEGRGERDVWPGAQLMDWATRRPWRRRHLAHRYLRGTPYATDNSAPNPLGGSGGAAVGPPRFPTPHSGMWATMPG